MPTLDATRLLEESKGWTHAEHDTRQAEVDEAFRVFWLSWPSELEFAAVMHRIRLSPTMLYIMRRTPDCDHCEHRSHEHD